ncbi:uncharacterized protein LOC128952299 [Oppia nitens]|uniref:uncharacterized protein LOC128952299 n=1 Tax=Oppia nitens TaxID=1686743 RepID=UPI0023DB08D8|nr:uncharacterized protein LOC128952299 [Oppia nitens]
MSNDCGGYTYDEDAINARKSDVKIHPVLLSRVSPREMTGELVSDEDINSLFEAARWAPSHYNLQPWRFIYAKRGTEHWQKFMDLLWPLNQQWCQTASHLMVVLSSKWAELRGEKHRIPTNSYDAGSAWMSMAIEGAAKGLVIHGIGGFDFDKAYEAVGANKDTHNVEAMIVVGKRPAKADRKQNETITPRNPINTFVSEGIFKNNDKF